jgi:hypothetical protein
MILKNLFLKYLYKSLIIAHACVFLPMHANELLDKETIQQPSLRIALPSQETLETASNNQRQQLIQFLREYWQVWAIDNQRTVKFIYLPPHEIYNALENHDIDVAAISVLDKQQQNVLYSSPFANFQQRVFRRTNTASNITLNTCIHSRNIQKQNFSIEQAILAVANRSVS